MRIIVELAGAVSALAAACVFYPHLVKDLAHCWWRLAAGGFVVSGALVTLAVPQAVKLSGGVLPTPTTASMLAILKSSLPTQTCFKTLQYFSLRTFKRSLDVVNPAWGSLNTILAYGCTATVMQSAAYNHAIKSTYNHHGLASLVFKKYEAKGGGSGRIEHGNLKAALRDAKVADVDAAAVLVNLEAPSYDNGGGGGGDCDSTAPAEPWSLDLEEFKRLVDTCEALKQARGAVPLTVMAKRFLANNILPGLAFSFMRECGATGAGIVLGAHVRSFLAPVLGNLPVVLSKIISGILAGMFTSLMTQWLHNNALRAGTMAQTGTLPSTSAVLKQTWSELGFKMFYLNAERRVLSTATATSVLGVVDIFA